MKKDIHPKYQPIIFHDVSCNKSFLISSTLEPKEKMQYEDGKEYPVFKIETLKGKKIMIVNTASKCGFTNQYKDLQLFSDNSIVKLFPNVLDFFLRSITQSRILPFNTHTYLACLNFD